MIIKAQTFKMNPTVSENIELVPKRETPKQIASSLITSMLF